MSTSKSKQTIIVGSFITIGLLILVVTIFTLGGQKKAFTNAITLKATFEDVSGLQKGNNVWYSGVKVGIVKHVQFSNAGFVEVVLSVENEVKSYIKKNSKAKVGTDGLIGNKIIVIYGGTEDQPVVQDGESLMVEKATSTDEMMATLQTNNKNLVAITENFKIISTQLAEGQGTLGAILKDSTMYLQLNQTLAKFKQTAENTERLTAGMSNYVADLQNPGSLTYELTHDTSIMANLKQAVSQLNEATASTSAITQNINDATASINNKLNSSNNAVGALLNDQALAEEIKQVMENLNAGTAKLDENMEALQHNFLFRGFFKKKAKQEKKAAGK